MPKRRSGSGAGSGLAMPRAHEEFFEPADFQLAEPPEEGHAEAEREAPIYREEIDSRLQTPLSLAEEVPRFHELWNRFEAGYELSPGELGELHEYAVRRLNLPARSFSRDRSPDNAVELVMRARQVEAVEAAITNGRELVSEERRGQVRRAREVLASQDEEDAIGSLSDQERRAFERYYREWQHGRDIPDRDLRVARALALRMERDKYRELLGLSSGGASLAELARAYGEHEDAAAFVSYLDNRIREADPGFSAPQPFSAERFRATIDYLRRRAGSLNGLEVPTGRVFRGRDARKERIPEPGAVESPPKVVFLVPPALASSRLREHAAAVGVTVVEEAWGIPQDADVVINWGARGVVFPDGFRVLNRENVGAASDKAECIQRLGDLAPRTTRDWEQARAFGDRVAAKLSRGTARGQGKEVLSTGGDAAGRNYRYDLFQEFFPERDEYRVVLLGDTVLTAHSKNAVPGSLPEDMAPRREYVRLDGLPKGVADMAREARRRVGLEFAGVDILRDRRTGRWYVLEVNAAPGMSETTLRRLVEEIARQRGAL